MKEVLWLALAAVFLQCSTPRQAVTGDVPLEDTYWKLSEIGGREVATPEGGREVHMILSQSEGRRSLKGYAGCNGLGGDYRVEGNTIELKSITTRMYCESQMDIENRFTSMLTNADNYRVTGDTLELYEGEVLLGKFTAKPGSR